MKTYLWLPLSCLNVAVAILLRKVSVAAVSSFAFNAAKLSTNPKSFRKIESVNKAFLF